MTVTVNTVSHDSFRHSIKIDEHEVFTDLPKTMGGESSTPPLPMIISMPLWARAKH